MGHNLKLISAQFVTPFVLGNTNDKHDALATAEASQSPRIIAVFLLNFRAAGYSITPYHYVANRVALTKQIQGITIKSGILFQTGHKVFREIISTLYKPQLIQLKLIMRTEIAQAANVYYWLYELITGIEQKLRQVSLKISYAKFYRIFLTLIYSMLYLFRKVICVES